MPRDMIDVGRRHRSVRGRRGAWQGQEWGWGAGNLGVIPGGMCNPERRNVNQTLKKTLLVLTSHPLASPRYRYGIFQAVLTANPFRTIAGRTACNL